MVTIDAIIQNIPWFKKLEILRVIKDWSQQEAANHCNVGHKVYWSWETGERVPQRNKRLGISLAFGVSEQEIFGDNPQKKAI